MQNILPKNVVEDILVTTGAYDDAGVRHIIQGEFKYHDFLEKKKDDVDLGLFEASMNYIRQTIEKDWRGQYFEGCVMQSRPVRIVDLKQDPLDDAVYLSKYTTNLFPEGFIMALEFGTFQLLLNNFLGGEQVSFHKKDPELTDIENILFKKISERICCVMNNGFRYLAKLDLVVDQLNLDIQERLKVVFDKYVLLDLFFTHKEQEFSLTVGIPMSFLRYVQDKIAVPELEKKNLDNPKWKKIVTDVFMNSDFDLKISLGQLEIPFSKSLSLQQGDILSWDKTSPEVLVYKDEKTCLKGSLGMVGENFAIQVTKVLGGEDV